MFNLKKIFILELQTDVNFNVYYFTRLIHHMQNISIWNIVHLAMTMKTVWDRTLTLAQSSSSSKLFRFIVVSVWMRKLLSKERILFIKCVNMLQQASTDECAGTKRKIWQVVFKKKRLGSLLSPSAYRWGGKSWVSLEWNRNKSFTYETLTQSVKCPCQ